MKLFQDTMITRSGLLDPRYTHARHLMKKYKIMSKTLLSTYIEEIRQFIRRYNFSSHTKIPKKLEK